MMCRSLRGALLLAAASLVLEACGSSRLTHFDRRDFDPVIEAELPNTAWLAVDSCSTGIHALVELELSESPNSGFAVESFSPSLPLSLRLEYGGGYSAPVRYARLEGPICTRTSSWSSGDPYTSNMSPVESCTYVYTAQFNLLRMPSRNQDFRLLLRDQSVLLAQR